MLISAATLLPAMLLTSCGDDEPEPPTLTGSAAGGNNSNAGTTDPGATTPDIRKLITQNVSVTASYRNYTWYVEIRSDLHSVLPGSDIRFGIGHGDVNGTTRVSVGKDAYKYSASLSGNTYIYQFENPFWFYYLFGAGANGSNAGYEDEWAYKAYRELTARPQQSLTSEERSLLSELTSILDKAERTARYDYSPTVQVAVDGTFHTVTTLHF